MRLPARSAKQSRRNQAPRSPAPKTKSPVTKCRVGCRPPYRPGTKTRRRRRRLAGDLDNIVLMALRKEPQRRYSSVAQFSEDIRRHLEGLPVVARKDTVGYRASKFRSEERRV